MTEFFILFLLWGDGIDAFSEFLLEFLISSVLHEAYIVFHLAMSEIFEK